MRYTNSKSKQAPKGTRKEGTRKEGTRKEGTRKGMPLHCDDCGFVDIMVVSCQAESNAKRPAILASMGYAVER
jgi:hypothetical protein